MKSWCINNISYEIDQVKKIIYKFDIFTSSSLVKCSGITVDDNKDINFIINKTANCKIETGIMITMLDISPNDKIYIFLLDDKILLFNQKYIHLLHDFIKKNQDSLLFLTRNDEEHFQVFLSTYSSDSIIEENEIIIDKSTLIQLLCNCIVKKSQYRTLQTRNNFLNDKDFSIKDLKISNFISIRNILPNYIDLFYNINDQLLYIMKKSKNFTREFQFYSTIKNKCKFISKIFGTIGDTSNKTLILEYIDGDTLYEFITKNENIEISIKIKLILDILLSVEFIHLNGIFLRDLKWDNIIVDSNNNAILIDFDSIKLIELDSDQTEEYTGNIGSIIFAAPEQHSNNFYTYKVDSYSLGLIIHFIITQIPYDPDNYILDFNQLSKCSNEFIDLYKNCLNNSPSARPTVSKILNDFIIKIQKSNCQEHIIKMINTIVSLRLQNIESIDESILRDDKKYYIDKSSIFYFMGKEYISLDTNKTIHYLELACEYKNLEASFLLGTLYYKGEFVPQDCYKAIKYFVASFDEKAKNSNNQVLNEFLRIDWDTQDIGQCIHAFSIAADNNEPIAQCFLGKIYWEGKIISRDINKSLKYLTEAANQNNSEAQTFLGKIYYYGKDIQKDINKSIYYLTLASKQDDTEAQYFLAQIYYTGENVERDINKTIHYLTCASNLGDSDAQACLGKIYLFGEFTSVDVQKSIYYLTLAAEKNHTLANYFLGYIYYNGRFAPRDIQKSIYHLKAAAKKNDAKSLYLLGVIYLNGLDIQRDVNLAIHYFTLSANQKDINSQFILGLAYLNGLEVPHNIEKSLYYLNLACEQNDYKSQCLLGEIYYAGDYVKRDLDKAIYYLSLAAYQNDSHAQFLLGKIYSSGCYIKLDINKALHYLTLSANQNNSDAQYYLGSLLYYGEIVPKDFNKSIHYLTLSSNQGNSDAQFLLANVYYGCKDYNKFIYYLTLASESNEPNALFYLGYLHLFGQYVHQDIKKAMKYLTLSSNLNNDEAQFMLGGVYFSGVFIEKNINKAIFYFTLAANQNHLKSLFFIGLIYYNGEYVPRDMNKAIHYLKQASSLNDYRAKNTLGIIYKNGDGVKKNILRAIEYFEEAINIHNDAFSMYNLARILYFGIDVKKNDYRAINLLLKASKRGLGVANLFISHIFGRLDYKDKQNFGQIYNLSSDFFQFLKSFDINKLNSKRVEEFFKQYDLFHSKDYNSDFVNFIFSSPELSIQEENVKILVPINEEFYHGFYDN